MEDIRVIKVSESILEIFTRSEISRELTIAFSARPEGYKFMPKYKQGVWDGWIRFYNYNQIGIGLLDELKIFAKKNNYSIVVDYDDTLNLDKDDFISFIDCLELPDHFEKRDYQIDAAYDCINTTKLCVKSNTASGKSLILYYIVRFMMLEDKKTLLIVPTTSLVEQMYKDWQDYGWKNIDMYVSRIYSGKFKSYDKKITIITWQSMIKDLKELKKFDALIIDESHHAKASSISTICKLCENAKWRLGFSGTYPVRFSSDWFSIVSNLGPIKEYTTYEMLKDSGVVSELQIDNLILKWPKEVCLLNYKENANDYNGENLFVESIERRKKFIVNLVQRLKGNTIVLFQRLDYGQSLYDMIGSDKCYYISGDTKVDDREDIRFIMEGNDGIILFASYGTFAQGVNIKRLHNVVTVSNYKSMIKVIQSIGRSIRVHESKEKATIYNIIDDLTVDGDSTVDELNYTNYSMLHYYKRLKIYQTEGFKNIEEYPIILK